MNNAENIKQMLDQLYSDSEQNGDAVFIVGSEKIRAYRNVLAAFSAKHKTQFYGSNPDPSVFLQRIGRANHGQH